MDPFHWEWTGFSELFTPHKEVLHKAINVVVTKRSFLQFPDFEKNEDWTLTYTYKNNYIGSVFNNQKLRMITKQSLNNASNTSYKTIMALHLLFKKWFVLFLNAIYKQLLDMNTAFDSFLKLAVYKIRNDMLTVAWIQIFAYRF